MKTSEIEEQLTPAAACRLLHSNQDISEKLCLVINDLKYAITQQKLINIPSNLLNLDRQIIKASEILNSVSIREGMQVCTIDKGNVPFISCRSRVIIPAMSCVVCAITVVKTAKQALVDLFYIASSVSLASHSSLSLLSSYFEKLKEKP